LFLLPKGEIASLKSRREDDGSVRENFTATRVAKNPGNRSAPQTAGGMPVKKKPRVKSKKAERGSSVARPGGRPDEHEKRDKNSPNPTSSGRLDPFGGEKKKKRR